MKCEAALQRLHDDQDSTEDRDLAERVSLHLERCPTCARAARDWRDVVAEVRRLRQSVEPEADLWPGIESRLTSGALGPKVFRRWREALAVAASGLLVLVLSWTALRRTSDAPVKASSDATTTGLGLASELARYEDRVLSTRRDLEGSVARSESRLPADVVDRIAADVQTLHRAIGEIRLALRQRPESRRLTLMLADRYRQEATLVKLLSRL